MKNDYKKTLFIIATIIFIISFCICEIKMLFIDSVDAYFNGTRAGFRFFGSQKLTYGFEGVNDSITGWLIAMIVHLWPITIFQIIYIIFFITIKIKSIKKNFTIDKNEKRLKTINYVCLIIYLIILFCSPKLNIFFIFLNPNFRCIPDLIYVAIIAIIEAIFILFIKKIAEINTVFSIILCSVSLLFFWISLSFETGLFIPVFLVILSVIFMISLIIYDLELKKIKPSNT